MVTTKRLRENVVRRPSEAVESVGAAVAVSEFGRKIGIATASESRRTVIRRFSAEGQGDIATRSNG